MKSNFSKGLLMTALITGSVIWGGTNVFAEEVLVPLMMYCKTLWALCQAHKVLMVQQWVL